MTSFVTGNQPWEVLKKDVSCGIVMSAKQRKSLGGSLTSSFAGSLIVVRIL